MMLLADTFLIAALAVVFLFAVARATSHRDSPPSESPDVAPAASPKVEESLPLASPGLDTIAHQELPRKPILPTPPLAWRTLTMESPASRDSLLGAETVLPVERREDPLPLYVSNNPLLEQAVRQEVGNSLRELESLDGGGQ